MVDDSALRIEATDSRAGVDTVLVDAGEAGDAVAVDHTLWPAAAVRVTKVVRSAAADAGVASHLGVSVGATRVGVAGISWRRLSCGRWITCRERVSDISRVTGAVRAVTLHPAGGSGPAHPGTGVRALVSNTCQAAGTVGVDGTLWLALNVRVALEPGETSTGGSAISIGALSIDTAR